MQAELVIDLNDLGSEIGRALGRGGPVLPSLTQVVTLWARLGIEVTAIHLVGAGGVGPNEDGPVFAEPHLEAWWEIESTFVDDEDFAVELHHSVMGDDAPIAQHALVVATALRRSDQIGKSSGAEEITVIVMSNAAAATSAVTHARGVPVMLAGTTVPDTQISHTRLNLSWMGMLTNRFARFSLPGIELHDDQPWLDGLAIGTPYNSLAGRELQVASLPTFAASVAIFDPAFFRVDVDDVTPESSGVATVVETLGLGALVHIESPTSFTEDTDVSETQLVAAMYRYATDHPHLPIIVASTRPALIVVTSQLEAFGLQSAQRFLRLCLPRRDSRFDESVIAGHTQAARIVVERSLSEPLFTQAGIASEDDSALSRSPLGQPLSPTLVLYSNPNTAKESSNEWRHATGRRFLLIGADVTEAVPADEPDAKHLPLSLGGCTDFAVRAPDLRPGCVVEGILNEDRDGWVVVSDPIERRVRERNVVVVVEAA